MYHCRSGELWLRLADWAEAGQQTGGDLQTPCVHPDPRADGGPPQDLDDGHGHRHPTPS